MKWKRLVVTKGVEIKLSRLFDDAEPLIQGGIMKEKKRGNVTVFTDRFCALDIVDNAVRCSISCGISRGFCRLCG